MSDPRRQRQRRQARRGQLGPGLALEQRIAFSPREVTLLAAGAMARLSLVQLGKPLQDDDITRQHLAFAGELAARLNLQHNQDRVGQCVHLTGRPAFYWTPSRPHAVLCPSCVASTPRPWSCDRCRTGVPPLRRWLAAAARPDGAPTGLIVVAYTCKGCERKLADPPADTPAGEDQP